MAGKIKTLGEARAALRGGSKAKAAGLPAWAEAFTDRDWRSVRSAADRVADEFAMTGEVNPETIMTSQGYVEVSSNFVVAYGQKVNRRAWK